MEYSDQVKLAFVVAGVVLMSLCSERLYKCRHRLRALYIIGFAAGLFCAMYNLLQIMVWL